MRGYFVFRFRRSGKKIINTYHHVHTKLVDNNSLRRVLVVINKENANIYYDASHVRSKKRTQYVHAKVKK